MIYRKFTTDNVQDLKDWFNEPNESNQFIRYYSEPDEWIKLIDNKERFGFAAYQDDEMVAFIDIELNASNASIAFGVSPDKRGQGIGREIVLWSEAFAKEHEIKSIYAGVEINNNACRRLLLSLGYSEKLEENGEIMGYLKKLA